MKPSWIRWRRAGSAVGELQARLDAVRRQHPCGPGDLESEEGRRALLEVSGNVTLETIAAYSATGVDHISIGRMTKSAPTLDIGLDIGANPSI